VHAELKDLLSNCWHLVGVTVPGSGDRVARSDCLLFGYPFLDAAVAVTNPLTRLVDAARVITMIIGRRGLIAIVYVLVSAFLLSTVFAVHTDLDGKYRPTCPACHLERNIGCISLFSSVGSALPEPEIIHIQIELRTSGPTEPSWFGVTCTRSPPSVL